MVTGAAGARHRGAVELPSTDPLRHRRRCSGVVVGFGLSGGFALAGRGSRWLEVVLGALALMGVAVIGAMMLDRYPASTAEGAWAALYGASMLAVSASPAPFPTGCAPSRG